MSRHETIHNRRIQRDKHLNRMFDKVVAFTEKEKITSSLKDVCLCYKMEDEHELKRYLYYILPNILMQLMVQHK